MFCPLCDLLCNDTQTQRDFPQFVEVCHCWHIVWHEDNCVAYEPLLESGEYHLYCSHLQMVNRSVCILAWPLPWCWNSSRLAAQPVSDVSVAYRAREMAEMTSGTPQLGLPPLATIQGCSDTPLNGALACQVCPMKMTTKLLIAMGYVTSSVCHSGKPP